MADLHALDRQLLQIRDELQAEADRLETCRPPGRAASVQRRLRALANRVESAADEIIDMHMNQAAEDAAKRESIFS